MGTRDRAGPNPSPAGGSSEPFAAGPSASVGGHGAVASSEPTADGSQPAVGTSRPARFRDDGFPVAGWDRYTFVGVLGHGGMGSVYRARDPRLGREVALKFIRGGDPTLAMRLVREARAQARVQHPNICRVVEVGEVASKVYVAMELVHGRTLHEARAEMSLHEKVTVMRDVAWALHEAHTLGILHRDVKPSNIMVEPSEDGRLRPVVMDFGIARDAAVEQGLTETGALLGTPAYMSPEQAGGGGRSLDRRSDVYSLGATLYELLTGKPPFHGASPMAVVLAVLYEEPTPLRALVPTVPDDLETIVTKCMHKDPGQRYDSARALAEDLDRYVRGEPILGRREGWRRRVARLVRKHRALVATGGLALGGLVVAGLIVVDTRLEARRREAELEEQADAARDIARDVEEMEWFFRTAVMLPLHDTTPERAIVEQRMARLAGRADTDATGQALIDYAVGRGHQVLQEHDAAHQRFVQALERGLDTPELHYALGLTLGRLYDREREELERWGDASDIDAERERLDREYLVAARDHLRRAAGSMSTSPAYVEGLLALYSHRYAEAVALAEAADQQAPWLYEAKVLAGDARIAIATSSLERGAYDEAEAEIMEALRLYQAASEIARSDHRVHEAEASAWIELMNHRHDRGGDIEEPYRNAILACRRASRADPTSALAYEKEVHAHARRAADMGHAYDDPRRIVEVATAAAERALELGDGGARLLDQLANLHSQQAWYEAERGIDPRQAVERAQVFYRRALDADPGFAWAWNDLGITEMTLAKWEMSRGGSVAPILRHLETSLSQHQRAVELDPDYVMAYANIIYDYSLLARVAAETGGPVEESVAAASRVAARAARTNDSYFAVPLNLCETHHVDARHRLLAGLDPRPAVRATLEQGHEAIRQNDRAATYCMIADAHRIAAEHVLAAGDVPLAGVLRGWAVLEDPKRVCAPAEHETTRARLLSVYARWLERLDRPADQVWQRARAVLAEGRRALGDHPELLLAIAETALQEADAARAAGRPVDAEKLLEAIAAMDRGLELQPWATSVRALLGALELTRARSSRAPAARRDATERATEALRAALGANVHLRRRYWPLLAEAARSAEP